MVFQQFNLFPHMTVLQNCMLAPMRSRGTSKAEAEALAMKYLTRVRIGDQALKYPSQLSGGQQQRVAIARALCMTPKRSEEHTSELQSLMRITYAVFCLKKKKQNAQKTNQRAT